MQLQSAMTHSFGSTYGYLLIDARHVSSWRILSWMHVIMDELYVDIVDGGIS